MLTLFKTAIIILRNRLHFANLLIIFGSNRYNLQIKVVILTNT